MNSDASLISLIEFIVSGWKFKKRREIVSVSFEDLSRKVASFAGKFYKAGGKNGMIIIKMLADENFEGLRRDLKLISIKWKSLFFICCAAFRFSDEVVGGGMFPFHNDALIN